jgi:preprotein translocase subunit SecD
VGFDQYGSAIVQLTLDREGGKIFDKVTFQNIGKRLAIVMDGQVYSAPVIRDRIPNGKAQISGNFKAAEASDLALVLRAGALPAPVTVVEERPSVRVLVGIPSKAASGQVFSG